MDQGFPERMEETMFLIGLRGVTKWNLSRCDRSLSADVAEVLSEWGRRADRDIASREGLLSGGFLSL